MIINGLGYTRSPLYLTPDFYAGVDVEMGPYTDEEADKTYENFQMVIMGYLDF